MDKTPDWIQWAAMQAAQVEIEQYKRIVGMLGFGETGKEAAPGPRKELDQAKQWGIGPATR